MMPIGMVTPKSTGKRVRKSTRKPKINVKLGNSVHGEVLDAIIRGVVQRPPTFSTTSASDNQGNNVATPDVEVDSVNSDYSSSGAISSASDISVRVDELDKKLTQMGELMQSFFSKCNVKNGNNVIDNNNAGSSGGHGGNAGIASDISNSDQLRINALEGKLSGVAKVVETINTTLLTLTQTLVQMQTKLDAPHIRQESAVQLPTSGPPAPRPVSPITRQSSPPEQQQQLSRGAPIDPVPNRNSAPSDPAYLNRLRSEREKFMIVFGADEEEIDEELNIGELEISIIDRLTVDEILKDMKVEYLNSRIANTQRLGARAEGRKRPIRVQFHTVQDRENACRNAYNLKDSHRFKHEISITRDKIREDRERDRDIYLAKKLARQNTITGANATPLNSTRNTVIAAGSTTVSTPLTTETISPTVEQTELRNPTEEEEQAHPQMVDQTNNP